MLNSLEKFATKGSLAMGETYKANYSRGVIPVFSPRIPAFSSVIPVKTGIRDYSSRFLDSRFRGNNRREDGNDRTVTASCLELFKSELISLELRPMRLCGSDRKDFPSYLELFRSGNAFPELAPVRSSGKDGNMARNHCRQSTRGRRI